MDISRRSVLGGILAAVSNPRLSIEKSLRTAIPIPKKPTSISKDTIGRIIFFITDPSESSNVAVDAVDGGFDVQDLYSGESNYLTNEQVINGIAAYMADADNFADLFTGNLDYITGEPIYGELNLDNLDQYTNNMLKNAMKKIDPYAIFRKIITDNFNNYEGLDDRILNSLVRYTEYWRPARHIFFGDMSNTFENIELPDIEKRLLDLRIIRPNEVVHTSNHNTFDNDSRDEHNEQSNTGSDNISSHQWMASTHGGFGPGQSQYYMGSRFFDDINKKLSVHCFTESYFRLIHSL